MTKTRKRLKKLQLVEHAQATDRRLAAWRLRIEGKSYRRIAEVLGVSPAAVSGYINDILDELKGQCNHTAENWRRIELERLDRLLEIWFPPARHATAKGVIAVSIVLRIIERRSKLLGLDAPVKAKLEHSTPNHCFATRADRIKALEEARAAIAATRRREAHPVAS